MAFWTFRPKLFVFENVPGILSAKPGGIRVTERVYNAFKEIGYEINPADKLHKNVFSADDYEFIGNNGVCYKMIGNAVPPKLAEAIANAVADFIG